MVVRAARSKPMKPISDIWTASPKRSRRGTSNMNTIVTLVERGGSARSFHVDGNRIADIAPILRANLSREAKRNTDEHAAYKEIGLEFASHDTANHSRDEYVRGDAYTNTVEGFYSIFKRGAKGVYRYRARNTCTAICQSLTSVIPTALPWVSEMGNVRTLPSRVRLASVSRIVNLTKSDFKRQARRFLRWRARLKKPKAKFVKYWRTE